MGKTLTEPTDPAPSLTIFGSGLAVGSLGGLVGLGGAEFRLPLLIGVFGFSALPAIIINKATSLIVVATSLPFRAGTVPFSLLLAHGHIIATLLAGSLIGAWLGADWATRLKSAQLHKILASMFVLIAGALLLGHGSATAEPLLQGELQIIAGVLAGFVIGFVAALMGVAGGELLIPTIVLLFGTNVKLAGSLSLVVSLPTMIVGFARYSQDRSFSVLLTQKRFVLLMAAGSIVGALLGGLMLGLVSEEILLPILAAILLISSIKVWRQP